MGSTSDLHRGELDVNQEGIEIFGRLIGIVERHNSALVYLASLKELTPDAATNLKMILNGEDGRP